MKLFAMFLLQVTDNDARGSPLTCLDGRRTYLLGIHDPGSQCSRTALVKAVEPASVAHGTPGLEASRHCVTKGWLEDSNESQSEGPDSEV